MRSGNARTRTRQSSRSAGTSRPVGSTQRASRTAHTARAGAGSASRPHVQEGARRERRASVASTGSGSAKAAKPRRSAALHPQATPTITASRGGRSSQHEQKQDVSSTSVGELRRADRMKRARKNARRHFLRIVAVIGVIVVVLAGWAALYNSPVFKIENVVVNGVEHLTSEEMAQLANVPADATLLRVDTATIESRVEKNAWVADARVSAVFPDTLEINVTERPIFAVVEIPTGSSATVKQWLIAEDHVWLMPIPDANSDAAKTTSSKVYEDAANALSITNVPYGTKAAIGEECSDANVNNALDILSGLTTELSGRIASVSAAGTAETTLILDNGVEVAFGKAENIRDKERVILQILDENADNVSYINVRIVDSPTWRSV